jgi:hypothetical protein
MSISRRGILIAGGTALLTADTITQAVAQQWHHGSHAMAGPEEMQVVQRGGLYANLHDPNITELPSDAFEQRTRATLAPRIVSRSSVGALD